MAESEAELEELQRIVGNMELQCKQLTMPITSSEDISGIFVSIYTVVI